MKTKEFDCFVHKRVLSQKDMYSEIRFFDCEDHIKAKLIIEIPDKKIEITESQFDEIFKKLSCFGVGSKLWHIYRNFHREYKKELGFTDD